MIYSVQGKITHIKSDHVVIETNGLSYQIFVTNFLIEKIKKDQKIKLLTYLEVRETAMELYGFEDETHLEYFKKLRSISGIGPKSAMNVLSLVRLSDLEKAIINEKVDILTKISGIGKKTAQRIILELKGKITKTNKGSLKQSEDDSFLIDALISMGYTIIQARETIKEIPLDIQGIKKRLKQA
ncbi:Holliday junction branch migration protein RuvA, partial [Patescibacteria group bacterium]|nr:Holliday junction branch migration protein RuvA [Patescibacteria group bacterium]